MLYRFRKKMVINSSIFHKITKNSFLKIEKTREITTSEKKSSLTLFSRNIFTWYISLVMEVIHNIVDVGDQHILLGRANRWCGEGLISGKDWPSMWGDWSMMWGWTDHWCEWTGCWCGVTDSWCGRTNWWCGEGLTDVGGLNDDVGGSNDDVRKYWDIDVGKIWPLIRGTNWWCGEGLRIDVGGPTDDKGKD